MLRWIDLYRWCSNVKFKGERIKCKGPVYPLFTFYISLFYIYHFTSNSKKLTDDHTQNLITAKC
ncbi:MAG: hypothetical protein CL840_19590 [Crocinitomicaceae bacterium]|nr:hypothetical protein [Crocinitomicaceae bacterium]